MIPSDTMTPFDVIPPSHATNAMLHTTSMPQAAARITVTCNSQSLDITSMNHVADAQSLSFDDDPGPPIDTCVQIITDRALDMPHRIPGYDPGPPTCGTLQIITDQSSDMRPLLRYDPGPSIHVDQPIPKHDPGPLLLASPPIDHDAAPPTHGHIQILMDNSPDAQCTVYVYDPGPPIHTSIRPIMIEDFLSRALLDGGRDQRHSVILLEEGTRG